jgi:type II secretory pathway pseudopilin PulG
MRARTPASFGKKSGRDGRAFTLVELVIVVSILTITVGGGFGLIAALADRHRSLEDALQAHEMGSRLLAQWRHDVRFASRIELDPDGQRMRIDRADGAGGIVAVTYDLSDWGDVLRRAEGVDAPGGAVVLAGGCRALVFRRLGGTYGIQWELVWSDGIRQWKTSGHGFATPIGSTSPD